MNSAPHPSPACDTGERGPRARPGTGAEPNAERRHSGGHMRSQQEYVLRTVEERAVRFVQLWFTDVLGTPKTFAITPAELENALEEGMTFDGSAIDGFSRVQESDVLARPDAKTFQILPWHPDEAPVARVFCDIFNLDGTPFEGARATSCAAISTGPGSRASPSSPLRRSSTSTSPTPIRRRHRSRSTPARTSSSPPPTWPATCANAASSPWRRWASPSSTPSTRTPPASTRSTCATPTPSPWPTP